MEILKNEIYIIEITDLGEQGEGIGHLYGFAVFVENAIPGDIIEAKIIKLKKNYGYAKLISIVKASEFRTEPFCSSFPKCGGCSLQHIKYAKQLELKTESVKNKLQRIGGFKDINVLPTIGMENPYNYRNKAQFPVGIVDGRTVIGFYRKNSHDIVNIKNCCIQSESDSQIIEKIREYIKENNISVYNERENTGIIRHILIRTGKHTNEIMVVIVVNANQLPYTSELIEKLKEVNGMSGIFANINRNRTNTILGEKTCHIWGKTTITDYIGDIRFEISPESFFQVNSIQTEILYKKAMKVAAINKDDIVIDAYCGIGTISLFMARKAKKVYGIEISRRAISDAKKNANINGISNVEFIVGKSEEKLPELCSIQIHPDVIIADPPRKGCEQPFLDAVAAMKPSRIVYISCNPATLARDLKYLCEQSYSISSVQPIDMFCHTAHVETVCLMSKVSE